LCRHPGARVNLGPGRISDNHVHSDLSHMFVDCFPPPSRSFQPSATWLSTFSILSKSTFPGIYNHWRSYTSNGWRKCCPAIMFAFFTAIPWTESCKKEQETVNKGIQVCSMFFTSNSLADLFFRTMHSKFPTIDSDAFPAVFSAATLPLQFYGSRDY
ncbi:hypothetical protein C8J56DRAFT_940565, partial [Mycena floridula]